MEADDAVEQEFAAYEPFDRAVRDGDPHEALKLVSRLASEAPDEGHLAALAVCLGEMLIDFHWQTILPELLDELRANPAMRQMLYNCMLSVPNEVEAAIEDAAAMGAGRGPQPPRPE